MPLLALQMEGPCDQERGWLSGAERTSLADNHEELNEATTQRSWIRSFPQAPDERLASPTPSLQACEMRRKQRSQWPPADTARASTVLTAAAELVVVCRRALGTNTGSLRQGESEAHTAGAEVT